MLTRNEVRFVRWYDWFWMLIPFVGLVLMVEAAVRRARDAKSGVEFHCSCGAWRLLLKEGAVTPPCPRCHIRYRGVVKKGWLTGELIDVKKEGT